MNYEHHQHLPFPFPDRATLTIRSQSREDVIVAELATSVIEKFQSASYRNGLDPDLPLALHFDNPSVQSYCLQNYLVPLEQIQVEYGTGKVSGIALLAPSSYPGSMIQAFSGLRYVILAAPGFVAKHNIEVQHSFITLKSINYAKQA